MGRLSGDPRDETKNAVIFRDAILFTGILSMASDVLVVTHGNKYFAHARLHHEECDLLQSEIRANDRSAESYIVYDRLSLTALVLFYL